MNDRTGTSSSVQAEAGTSRGILPASRSEQPGRRARPYPARADIDLSRCGWVTYIQDVTKVPSILPTRSETCQTWMGVSPRIPRACLSLSGG